MYADLDSLWLSDPRPYLQKLLFEKSKSSNPGDGQSSSSKPPAFVAQLDAGPSKQWPQGYYCTGLMAFVGGSRAASAALRSWDAQLTEEGVGKVLNQPAFNSAVKKSGARGLALPMAAFPAGNGFKWNAPETATNADGKGPRMAPSARGVAIVHNNYIKVGALRAGTGRPRD